MARVRRRWASNSFFRGTSRLNVEGTVNGLVRHLVILVAGVGRFEPACDLFR